MKNLSWRCAHFLAGALIFVFFFITASSVNAALSAPVLADPIASCSGINPRVTLIWSAVSGAMSYAVFKDGDDTPLPAADQTLTTLDDTAVNPTETHTYTVQAKNDTDTSQFSNAKTITVPHCGTIVHLVSAMCFASGPEIKISWDALPSVDSYTVLRDGASITSPLLPSQTDYTDMTAIGGQSYIYSVRTAWTGDTKDSQNDVSLSAPACPVTLVANGNCNAPGANATLTWNSLPGILSYEVFRDNSYLAPTSGTSFDDSGVTQKSSYSYKIRALYAHNIADSVTVPNVTIPRCAPVLTAQNTCNASNTTIPEIKLSWSDTADATIYNITETVKGFIAQLTGTPPAKNYTDTDNIQNDSTYTYSIQAQGSFSPDLVSNPVSVIANCSESTIPSPAPEVSVAPICTSGVAHMSLSWTSANNVLYYTIHRTNNNLETMAPPQNVTSGTIAIDQSDIELNTSYTYSIDAVGNGGSISSIPVTKTSPMNCTPPGTPTLATPALSCINGQSTVDLSWASSFNATSYEVYQNSTKIKVINDQAVTTYRDQSTANATPYTYEIRAVGPGGSTSSGDPRSVTTPDCAAPSPPVLTVGEPMCSSTATLTIPLTWTSSSNVLYYNVYRRKTGDSGFSPIKMNLVVTNFTDSGLAQNIPAVDYFIETVGPMGTIPSISNQAGRSTPWCPPPTPTLSATPWCAGGQSTINLAWTVPAGTSGLVAGYALNEGGGTTANDISGSNNKGTLANSPTWTAGKNDGGLSFDGVDDYVATALKPSSSFTWSAWIKVKAFSNYGSIITASGGTYMLMDVAASKAASFWSPDGLGGATLGISGLSPNTWYHITFVREGNSITSGYKAYLNGALKGQANTGVWSSSDLIRIGGRNGTTQYFTGSLDDVRIYNRALSQSEIQADMAAPLGTAPLVISYEIKKDTATLANLAPPTSTYPDNTGLTAGTSYSYKIIATGQGGSATPAQTSATALNCALPEAPIVTPMALCSGSTPQMKLSWQPTANTASYDVFRGATKLTNILFNAATLSYSYTDTPLSANTTYTYTVVSNGLSGSGTASSIPVSPTTLYCIPSQPASFTLTPQCNGSISQYKMTWTDPTPSNTKSYEIRRDGNPTPIKILAVPTALSWTDNNNGLGFPAGQSHSYTVTAVGPAGSSPASPILSATSFDCSKPDEAVLQLSAPMCVGGTALSFNGIAGRMTFASTNYGKVHTVSLWIDYKDTGNGVVLGGSNLSQGYAPYINAPGTGGLMYYSAGGNTVSVVHGGFTSGTWTHIAMVRNGLSVMFYKNGVQIGTTQTLAVNTDLTLGAIGSYTGGGFPTTARIDEVNIYNRALTQAEIISQYNGGAGQYGVPEAGLVSGWHFEEGSGTTAADYSGNNITGTLINGPVWTASPVAPKTGANAPFVQVPMQWDTTSNTTKYQVVRGSTVIATVPSISGVTTYNYNDTSYSSAANVLTSGTFYTYKINSLSDANASATSKAEKSEILPWCSPTPPVITGSPSPSCSAGKSSFSLAWTYTQPYANTSSFEIRRDDGSGMAPIKNLASSGTGSQSYPDTNGGAGLAAGTNYAYQIAAVGPTGNRTLSASSAPREAISCEIPFLVKNSQCSSIPGINPLALLTWPYTTQINATYLIAKKEGSAAYQNNYLTISDYSNASPTTIRDWLILGTFPNTPDPAGLNTDYIGEDPNSPATESTILPRAGETINGKTWKTLAASVSSDYTDFTTAAAFGPQTNMVGYAFAYIVNTGASDVSGQLRLGGDDGIKAFFNGDKLYTFARTTSSARDSQVVQVTLKPGINTLLIKVSQIGGSWGFWARLTDSSGNPLLSTITTADSGVTKGVTSDYYVWSAGLTPSPVVTDVTPSCSVVAPEVTAVASCPLQQGQILLTWPATAHTTYYHVYRSSFADFSQATQLTAGNPIYTDPSILSYTYTDLNVEQQKDYYYSVEAVGNGSNFSSLVPITSSLCAVPPDKPDLKPDNIQSLCAGTSARIVLDWSDPTNIGNTISYTVYRNDVALTPSVTGSAFTDQSGIPPSNILVADATYNYKVQATGSGGSTFSDQVATKALNCSGHPAPPDLNPPVPLTRSTQVYLSWKDNSVNEDGFRIHRSVTVASAARSLFANLFDYFRQPKQLAQLILDTLPTDSVFTVDTSSQEDVWYEYQVEAFNSAGPGFSSPKKVYVPILPPGNFTLTTSCIPGKTVTLDWSPGAGTTLAGGPVTYDAYWSDTQNGSYTIIVPPCPADITGTSCSAPIPDPNAFFYKVTAKNNGGTTDAIVPSRCTNPRYEEVRPQ
ncbi:MAG: LamG-like jellyroll fold domain-containing protein [bacterium]|nr:LamG-like jellyroll fold domain-containing protein [bacterium]